MRSLMAIVVALIMGPAMARGEVISFQSQGRFFKADKTKQSLLYTDQLGTRMIKLKDCNRGVVDDFWNGMVKKIKGLQLVQSKSKSPVTKASVRYGDKTYGVLEFEAGHRFFTRVPINIETVFAESMRVCKK